MVDVERAELRRQLAEVVGEDHVVTDPDVSATYEVDWTGRFRGRAAAVVRPADTAEVAGVVRACDAAGAAVVAQGGNTGLVGGGVPLDGEVVLSLRRLAHLGEVDVRSGQVTAGAGVTIAALQAHARAAGWDYGIDLAARDSATVGGTVATNAGGLRVLRHGDTRHQLLGVEAVLAGGQVVSHLGGLLKDNTGYDLAGLLCGSEGTLGVVTAARLRLVPPDPHRVVALLGLPGLAEALDVVSRARRRLPGLQAAEGFLAAGVDLVCRQEELPHPFPSRPPTYLLLEVAGWEDPTDDVAELLAGEPAVTDSALASDGAGMARLWRYREAHTTSINAVGTPRKYDVTLPADRLAAFAAQAPATVEEAWPGAGTWLFGHVGDGNLHVNVTPPAGAADGAVPPGGDDALDGAVLGLAAAMGGSISAEHGIGRAKRRWLGLNRTPEEIAAFRAVKAALDPRGTLNPAALLPPLDDRP